MRHVLLLLVAAFPALAHADSRSWVAVQSGVVSDAWTITAPPGVTPAPPPGAWIETTGVSPAPQPGWLATQSGDAWSFGPDPVAAAQAQAAALQAAGITITSASAPGMNGTYALSSEAVADTIAAGSSCAAWGTFPDGTTTTDYQWSDISGAFHAIPDCAHMTSMAKAVGAFLSALKHGRPPPNPVSIP